MFPNDNHDTDGRGEVEVGEVRHVGRYLGLGVVGHSVSLAETCGELRLERNHKENEQVEGPFTETMSSIFTHIDPANGSNGISCLHGVSVAPVGVQPTSKCAGPVQKRGSSKVSLRSSMLPC